MKEQIVRKGSDTASCFPWMSIWWKQYFLVGCAPSALYPHQSKLGQDQSRAKQLVYRERNQGLGLSGQQLRPYMGRAKWKHHTTKDLKGRTLQKTLRLQEKRDSWVMMMLMTRAWMMAELAPDIVEAFMKDIVEAEWNSSNVRSSVVGCINNYVRRICSEAMWEAPTQNASFGNNHSPSITRLQS